MADKINRERRSLNMAAIRSKNTKPELTVRKALYALGIRYSVHRKDLPGKPDIYIPKFRLAVFVHGCFWHMHEDCIDGHVPKNQSKYWLAKLEKNVERDRSHLVKLKELGIIPVIIWECEVKVNDVKLTQKRLMEMLDEYEIGYKKTT